MLRAVQVEGCADDFLLVLVECVLDCLGGFAKNVSGREDKHAVPEGSHPVISNPAFSARAGCREGTVARACGATSASVLGARNEISYQSLADNPGLAELLDERGSAAR
jgi:hypothetical protein